MLKPQRHTHPGDLWTAGREMSQKPPKARCWASHVHEGLGKILSPGQKPLGCKSVGGLWPHGGTWPCCHRSLLFPQLCASLPVRTGAPAAGPSSASAALASVGRAVRKSSLRRNLTPRMPSLCPDGQWRGHPALTEIVRPEEVS